MISSNNNKVMANFNDNNLLRAGVIGFDLNIGSASLAVIP